MVKREKKVKKIQKKRGKDNSSLENIVHIVGIFGAFLCSLIFLSGGITGNTILNYSFKSSNLISVGLFLVGIVASFLYTKKK
jgi:hypothetical protein